MHELDGTVSHLLEWALALPLAQDMVGYEDIYSFSYDPVSDNI